MKTSNKISLSALGVLVFCFIALLIYAKSNTVKYGFDGVAGDGNIVKRSYEIENIYSFEAFHGTQLFIKKGEPHLEIETDENIHAFLRPTVNNRVYYDGESKPSKVGMSINRTNANNFQPTDGIKIYLTVPSIEELSLSEFATLTFLDTLTTDEFSLQMNVAAHANLLLNTKKLNIDASEHSVIHATGKAEKAKLTISVGTVVNAFSMETDSIVIDASEHSTLDVFANEVLDVNASVSSVVRYKGNPEKVKKNLSEHAVCEPMVE